MGSRYKYFRTVWNSRLKHKIKGLPNIKLFNDFRFTDDISYRIPLKYEYRPDLIALEFYGDPRLFWVIVYANGFNNSPQDFNTGRVIKIPRYERIISLI